MIQLVNTEKKPCALSFDVRTSRPQKIGIMIADELLPNTYYMNRWKIVEKEHHFSCELPINSDNVELIVYNTNDARNLKQNYGFEVGNIKIDNLKRDLSKIPQFDIKFIRFANWVSRRCAIMSPGAIMDDDGYFRFDLLKNIHRDNGQVHTTPCRIEMNSKRIEISLNKFLSYSVPGRVALLLHEFGHGFLNFDPANEEEADVKSLLDYLYYGYPKIEAKRVWLKVFGNSPSDYNRKRYGKIKQIIDDFSTPVFANNFYNMF